MLEMKIIHTAGGGTVTVPLSMESIRCSYNNQFTEIGESRKTAPIERMWDKGSFEATSFSLELAVDGDAIKSAAQLIATVEKLGKMAMPLAGEYDRTRAVIVTIGSWYYTWGLMSGCDVTFKPPWDIDTGAPMVAEVSFTVYPSYGKKPPTANDFSFKRT
jgi:hypothetical protein